MLSSLVRTVMLILDNQPLVRPVGITTALAVTLATGLSVAPGSVLARPEMAGMSAHNATTPMPGTGPAMGTGGGMASPVSPEAIMSRFRAMDTNGDGKVGREEFFAAQPQMKDAAFTAIDTDGDGFITAKEWEIFLIGHARDEKAAHPQGAAGMPPPANATGRAAPELIMPKK